MHTKHSRLTAQLVWYNSPVFIILFSKQHDKSDLTVKTNPWHHIFVSFFVSRTFRTHQWLLTSHWLRMRMWLWSLGQPHPGPCRATWPCVSTQNSCMSKSKVRDENFSNDVLTKLRLFWYKQLTGNSFFSAELFGLKCFVQLESWADYCKENPSVFMPLSVISLSNKEKKKISARTSFPQTCFLCYLNYQDWSLCWTMFIKCSKPKAKVFPLKILFSDVDLSISWGLFFIQKEQTKTN